MEDKIANNDIKDHDAMVCTVCGRYVGEGRKIEMGGVSYETGVTEVPEEEIPKEPTSGSTARPT